MRTRWIAAALACATVAAAALPAAAQTPVRFILNWKYEGPNAPFFLAEDRGYFAAEGVKVQLDAGEGSSAPPTRIGSGSYDAGFGDINAMIEFVSKNPAQAMRVPYMLYNRPPMVVVSMKAKGIAKPGDLVGKTLGAPQFDTGFRMWPAFAKAAGLAGDAVKWQHMQANLRESLLIRGDVDAITGFDSTVGFALRNVGIGFADISMIYYADHGIDVYSNGIIVAQSFIDRNPTAVRGLLKAINKGWQDSIADPAAAIAALMKRDPLLNPGIAKEHLEWVLKNNVLTPETAEFGLGAMQPARLARAIDIVAASFGLATKPAVADIYTDAFLPPAAERKPARGQM